jgi:hypothetical protein
LTNFHHVALHWHLMGMNDFPSLVVGVG